MSSGTKTLAFGYDAGGNRVRKESTASSVTTKQWYVRDAQGNIMSTYKQIGTGTLKQEYVYLYGSTRVGEYLLNRDSATIWNRHYYRVKGNRHYELTNHLGNVLAVVTDRKMAKDTTADATYTPQFFMPDVYSVQNYYAFGQSMPNWSSTAAVNDPKKYRFGFNGKEDDDEWAKQDYGARIYDGRVGRWLSTDPLAEKREWLSPYNFVQNNPMLRTDPTGALDWIPEVKETKNADGEVTSAKLVLKAEQGDNAQTLAKFLNTDQNKADKLFANMQNETVTPTNDIAGVKAINAAIKDYVDNPNDYSTWHIGNLTHKNYNCWESAISISQGRTPNFTKIMDRFDFKKEITTGYADVADTPNRYKFGRTVIRMAESHWNIIYGSYSVTTHGAVYLGTSNDGTQYTWSKNGFYNKPGILKLNDLIDEYGKVEGYRPEPGGGYYNPR